MLDRELIYSSSSPWAAKVVLAPKEDSWRMCLDYRGLNLKTKPDKYPLPHIEDLYQYVATKRYFSKIDLLSGYW